MNTTAVTPETIATARSIKTLNIIYWTSTIIYVLFDSVGAIAFNTQPAIEGIRHLGFPDYFRVELAIGKMIGGILLIVPAIPHRFREWAYVGFGICGITATIGHLVVDGNFSHAFMPVVVLVVLLVSYITYHKRLKLRN